METAGIAVDLDQLPSCSAVRRPGQGRRRGGVRRDRQARSTSARPSSCRSCCSTNSRCRRPSAPRPATPPTPTRCSRCSTRPGTRSSSTCWRHRDATRLKVTVDGLLKAVADDGRIHTTFNQTDRRHRPAVVDRAEPAEHPDPHRRGPPDPRRLRGRGGLDVADDRRLQPDRDADHGAPVQRRGLIEAFNTGEDLHSFVASRAFGVPIDEVTAELRRRVKAMSYGLAYGRQRLRPGRPAEDLHRGGQGPDGRSTSPGSAACATT